MSILIGGTHITSPISFTNEKISLSSATESNLINVTSSLNDINICLRNSSSNSFTIGKSGNILNITDSDTVVASFSANSNVLYTPTYFIHDTIGTHTYTNELDTNSISITPDITSTSNTVYLNVSNSNGTLITAASSGFVNIIGTLNIGTIESNSEYSFMVDCNAYIGNELHVSNIITQSIKNNDTSQEILFNQYTPLWGGSQMPSTQINGNVSVNGTIYANKILSEYSATSFNILHITSNITTPSTSITNISSLTQPSFSIDYTNYSNYDIVDINITTSSNSVDAFTITSDGVVYIGNTAHINYSDFNSNSDCNSDSDKQSALLNIQPTIYTHSCDLLSVIDKSNNSKFHINNSGYIGIGTAFPKNNLHISEHDTGRNACNVNTDENDALLGLYTCNCDFISGYMNDSNVFNVSSSGNIKANNFTTSNSVSASSVYTSSMSTPNGTMCKSIDFTSCSISNIVTVNSSNINSSDITNSNTIYTNSLNATSVYASNLYVPNISICNSLGYYGVFTPQFWFTGSNIVLSSMESDRIANSYQGKLVIRTDDQTVANNTNALGINVIGNQASSIRVTSLIQPNLELFGPNTSTYMGATTSTDAYGGNMLYISHLLNTSPSTNVISNPQYAQIKLYATDTYGNSGGTLLENLVSININNNRNIGIGISSTNTIANTISKQGSLLQVQGSLLLQSSDSAFSPILYATDYNNYKCVGIATINPVYTLDVNGIIRTSSDLYVNNNLGVGTKNPIAELHVVGNSYFTNNIGIGRTPSNDFILDVQGNSRFNGNVVIDNLTTNGIIDGTVQKAITVLNGYQPNINTLNSVIINDLTVKNTINGNISGNAQFVTNPSQPQIQSLPNVYRLGENIDVTIANPSHNIFIEGNTIIGQTNTTNTQNEKLYVSGACTITNNVNIYGQLFTNGPIGTLSDKSIKTHLVQIDSPLEKISKLTGYTYTRTDIHTDSDIEKYGSGLLAQDVEKVLPEVVHKNTAYNDLLSISYGNMAGLWVEAFKELMTEISVLKERIHVLENTGKSTQ